MGSTRSGGTSSGSGVDSTAVHKTGAEAVAGVKTFSSTPVVPDGSFGVGKLSFDPATQAELDAATRITPSFATTLGTAYALDVAGERYAVFEGIASSSSCALTVTGFPLGVYSQALISVVGSSGKTVTFPSVYGTSGTDPIAWQGGNGAPVFSTTGTTEFVLFTLDGVNVRGAHAQQPRTLLWGPGSDTTLVSSVGSPPFPIFKDSRFIAGIARLITAGTVQSTIVNVKINGTTAYGTTPANRPTIATSGTSSGSITLPDTLLMTPGQYVTFDVAQFGTSAAGLSIALRVLEAV